VRRSMVKVSGKLWLSAGAWLVLLGVLIIGLRWSGVSSVLVGGALGAFCGATLVVVYGAWERAATPDRKPSSVVEERYGHR
jgi:hypothetical protein